MVGQYQRPRTTIDRPRRGPQWPSSSAALAVPPRSAVVAEPRRRLRQASAALVGLYDARRRHTRSSPSATRPPRPASTRTTAGASSAHSGRGGGESLAPPEDRPGRRLRHPTTLVGLRRAGGAGASRPASPIRSRVVAEREPRGRSLSETAARSRPALRRCRSTRPSSRRREPPPARSAKVAWASAGRHVARCGPAPTAVAAAILGVRR
jgi:hypothetical protein